MNNNLCGMRSYLIGAMDRVQDGGVGWRKDITPFLNDLGVIVFDPTNKPIDIGVETPAKTEVRRWAKLAGSLKPVQKDMKIIRNVDLRMVDITDFEIANIDVNVHACGSYEEISLANRQKKPVLVHIEGGIQHTPDWLVGMLPLQHLFGSWDDLKQYLIGVNNHPNNYIKEDTRWVFFNLAKPTLKVLLQAAEHDDELHKLIVEYYESQEVRV